MLESHVGEFRLLVTTDQVGVVADLGFLAGVCAKVEVDFEVVPWFELFTRH